MPASSFPSSGSPVRSRSTAPRGRGSNRLPALSLAGEHLPLGLTAVARELGTTVARVRELITHGPLFGFRGDRGELLVMPESLRAFQRQA
jgi:hypothetical protein